MGSFSVFHWIIVAGIIFLIYKALRGSFGSNGKISPAGTMICPNCGTRGDPKTITKGSTLIELVLWLCFIIPGLIYSIWRLSSRQPGCPACGQVGMIGITTPNGQLLLKKFTETVSNIA